MKNILPFVVALLGLSLLNVSCLKDSVKRKYTIARPVYALKQDVLNDIKSGAPRPISSPGKMFLVDILFTSPNVEKGFTLLIAATQAT